MQSAGSHAVYLSKPDVAADVIARAPKSVIAK
jgi:hypothetical protein